MRAPQLCLRLAALLLALPALAEAGEPGVLSFSPATLIVAGERGVEEIGPDGKVVRVISRTPGHHPRFIKADELLLLSGQRGRQLLRLSLRDGASAVVATLPRLWCNDRSDRAMAVRTTDRFTLDPGRTFLCAEFRNDFGESATVRLDVPIWRVTVSTAFSARGHCQLGPSQFFCDASPPHDPMEETRRQRLLARWQTPSDLRAFGIASESPSGRWAVLEETSSGAIIVRVLILDRSGNVYPLSPGPWPKPLSQSQRDAVNRGGGGATPVATGVELRWVEVGGQDVLIVNRPWDSNLPRERVTPLLRHPRAPLLVFPGSRSVPLHGEVAF